MTKQDQIRILVQTVFSEILINMEDAYGLYKDGDIPVESLMEGMTKEVENGETKLIDLLIKEL